ncbi:hypothetical protein ACSSZE_07375 [Acidithiobacillus caldus]|uniref:Uncharacterized protein n=2 Tax=Acidithiobacillus caldus TaxID=33059 RepID=F9ZQR4_ACICS|nr:hypothetical protein [Acidithiobacillus caldus]AEK58664.1 hypothetical protein Atc_2016 [Acidithiobacillus caldus SM-1]OFC58929.1 hypothetical protein BAE30_08720 [Acidithiobacillus caldus]
MRIEIRLNASTPELLAEMEKLPARARAERLRFLAQMGWMVLSGKLPAGTVSATEPEPPAAAPQPLQSPARDTAKARAMARIGASFPAESEPKA